MNSPACMPQLLRAGCQACRVQILGAGAAQFVDLRPSTDETRSGPRVAAAATGARQRTFGPVFRYTLGRICKD